MKMDIFFDNIKIKIKNTNLNLKKSKRELIIIFSSFSCNVNKFLSPKLFAFKLDPIVIMQSHILVQ